MKNNVKAQYFDTDVWQAVPMISRQLIDAGYEGGEGCQACTYITCDPVEGKVWFVGTDVGGMYKSTDSGNHWLPCTVGFEACGGTGFAFDPNNINRVLCSGCNSYGQYQNGLHLSTDCGETWRAVHLTKVCGYRDKRTQIAFDETSYDEKIDGSAVVYWSREGRRYNYGRNKNNEFDPGLFKSLDGGETWEKLPNTERFADADIFVDRNNGWLFVGTDDGFFRSVDGGKTFKRTLAAKCEAMDCIRSQPDDVYFLTASGLYISHDCGTSFEFIRGEGFPLGLPAALRVSPVNPDRMVLQNDMLNFNGTWHMPVYYTDDGGKTWRESARVSGGSWGPSNDDQTKFCWHPLNEKRCLCTWCYICASDDGGASFHWNNAGYNGICTGGKFNWNVNRPELMLLGSQDYNGGYTTDCGKSWTYVNWSGEEWGGWTYGGYAISEKTMVTGIASCMFGKGNLSVTFDGGKTVKRLGLDVKRAVACGVPGDDKIVMFGQWRTSDGGESWAEMQGCSGVYTYDCSGDTLFGLDTDSKIVMSRDKGISWQTVVDAKDARISDMAYNYKTGRLYFTSWGHLYSVLLDGSGLCNISYPSKHVGGVCVDPENPNIIYIACGSNEEYGFANVLRSLDDGASWTVLTRTPNDGRKGPDGGRAAGNIRINPATREVFVSSGCRGIWKIPCAPANAGKQ